MVLLDIGLNITTLGVAGIAVGLGIDYPIHIIERYEEQLRLMGVNRLMQAMQSTLATMGTNIFGAALTSIIGFVAFCVLATPVAETFGLLTAFTIFTTYLLSIFLLPILLVGRSTESLTQHAQEE